MGHIDTPVFEIEGTEVGFTGLGHENWAISGNWGDFAVDRKNGLKTGWGWLCDAFEHCLCFVVGFALAARVTFF
ncbi:MAG: hypothetical protein LWW81_11745 [Rhodocyclales bacterium]|nr:hypothetical protein [Rhodocyclales bacterium]